MPEYARNMSVRTHDEGGVSAIPSMSAKYAWRSTDARSLNQGIIVFKNIWQGICLATVL